MTNVHVLSFHGELDMACKAHINRELSRISLLGTDPVAILDLSDVKYIDSTFLNELARAESHKIPGTRICVVASAFILRVLTFTSFDRVIALFEDAISARRFADSIDSAAAIGA